MTTYKIQYSTPDSDERQNYETYENPRSEYDTEEEAKVVIAKVRLRQTNVLRQFYVTAVDTVETVMVIVPPAQLPPPEVEPEFTVTDNREMGIQGVVQDEERFNYEHGDGGVNAEFDPHDNPDQSSTEGSQF